MKIIITAVGSAGDVYPFLAIAKLLKERTSHDIVFIANERFRSHCEAEQLEFYAHGTVEDYERSFTPPAGNIKNPFTYLKGAQGVMYYNFFKPVQPTFNLIKQHRDTDTLLIAHGVSFGARLARDAFQIPLITGVLSPVSIPGNKHQSFSPLILWIGAAFFKRPINKFCLENGLPKITGIDGWSSSPDKIAALFPSFFEKDMSYWPDHAAPVGYLAYNSPGDDRVVEEIARFIGHEPTILFTPGTPVRIAGRLFREAIKICRGLNRKGIFITDYRAQVPEPLPDFIKYIPYAPFHRVFPLCEVIVHHGGIGTSMECFLAGKPQLVVPYTADQPFNAARLKEFQVAEILPLSKFDAEIGASKIQKLLESQTVQENCRALKEKMEQEEAEEKLLKLINSMMTIVMR